MGADLTIVNPLPEYENEDFSYFRDSYNSTNVLQKFDLSYWQLADYYEKAKMYDEEGAITLNAVLDLRAKIDKNYYIFQEFLDKLDMKYLTDNHCSTNGEDPVQGWRDYWSEKSIRLCAFLDRAIESRSGIRWSV